MKGSAERKDIRKGKLGFMLYTESYYWHPEEMDDARDTEYVYIGSYAKSGGCLAEAVFRFTTIGQSRGQSRTGVKFEAWEDSWLLLAEIPGLLEALARLTDLEEITPKDLCRALVEIGFEDRTEREDPHKPALVKCSLRSCDMPVADPSLDVCYRHLNKDALLLRLKALQEELGRKNAREGLRPRPVPLDDK